MASGTRWYTPMLSRRTASLESDVIYDSEPERQETRKHDRHSRKLKKQRSDPPDAQHPVIELSSGSDTSSKRNSTLAHVPSHKYREDFEVRATPAPMPEPLGYSSASTVTSRGSRRSPSIITVSSGPSYLRVTGTDKVHHSLRQELEVSAASGYEEGPHAEDHVVEGDSNENEPPMSLNLRDFAFTSSVPVPRSTSANGSRASSVAVRDDRPAVVADPSIPSRLTKAGTRAFSDISDRDLAKVLKCVCCKLAWTTRKSVAQKVKHIQTCSKKHKLDIETVRTLLLSEIADSPDPKGKGKERPVNEEKGETPRTLLEDAVVNDTTGKKKGRRPPVVETVKNVADTRSDIIARARLLLNDQEHNGDNLGDDPKPRQPDHEAEPALPPSTQPFGDSALAHMFQARAPSRPPSPTQAYVPTSTARHSSPPPLTQPFAESALARMLAPRKANTGANSPNHDKEDVIELSSDADEREECSLIQQARSINPAPDLRDSSRDPHQRLHSAPDLSDNPLGSFNDPYPDWRYDDGAILYFSGADDLGSPSYSATHSIQLPTLSTNATSPKANHTIPHDHIPITSSHPPRIPSRLSSTKAAKARKQPARIEEPEAGPSQGTSVTLTDEELHERLKESIIADTELYLRILRYEPVHFDTFVKLATDIGVSSRSMKNRVKTFLDKQAIHFYGHDITASRTKKRSRY